MFLSVMPKATLTGPPHRVGRCLPRGFTLVEILVVLAIIAVLATLLMPLAQRMSASAAAAKCSSNLREIGKGYALFSADNNGDLPYTWNQGMSAVTEIGPYISVPGWWSMIKGEPAVVTVCPSDNAKRRDGWPSYAFNIHLGDKRNGPRRKRVVFANPSKLCVAGDAPSDGRGDLFLMDSQDRNADSGSKKFQWEARHSGGANVLFLDGHVELMKAPFPYGSTNSFWH